jgi:hypothetical protein
MLALSRAPILCSALYDRARRARTDTSTHYHIKSGRLPRRGAAPRAAPLARASHVLMRPRLATGLFSWV